MVWPNRGAFGVIGGYGLNVLKLLQGGHRCCRYAAVLASTRFTRQSGKPKRYRPYSLSRPRAGPSCLHLLVPSECEGMARQGALPSSVYDPHLLAEMRKAPRGAPPEQPYVRAHLRASSSASPNVGSGTAAPGRALRFRAFGLPVLPAAR